MSKFYTYISNLSNLQSSSVQHVRTLVFSNPPEEKVNVNVNVRERACMVTDKLAPCLLAYVRT